MHMSNIKLQAAWEIARRGQRAVSDLVAYGIQEMVRVVEETVQRIEEDHAGRRGGNRRNNRSNRRGPRQTVTIEVLDGRESSS